MTTISPDMENPGDPSAAPDLSLRHRSGRANG